MTVACGICSRYSSKATSINYSSHKDICNCYSINTVTFQKQTEWEVLDEVTIAIAKRLRKDKMARPKS